MLQAAKYINGRFINRLPSDIAYYLHLDLPGVITRLQYRYRNISIVYGIRCQVDNHIYIGSTSAAGLRFHNHLISGNNSNHNLQSAIHKHGLGLFTVHIYEEVNVSSCITYEAKQALLRQREQRILNQIPREQLYNTINATR